MKIFVTWIGEKAWRVFLVAGMILAILAVTGGIWKTDLVVKYPQFLPFIIGSAILLMLVGVGLAIYDVLNPPPPSPELGPQKIDPKKIGVEIKKPKWEQTLLPPIILEGIVKKLLDENVELWLFSKGTQEGHDTYWPQNKIDISAKREWKAEYVPKYSKDREPRTLQPFLVGPEGRILIAFYRQANKHFIPKNDASWQGLIKLTSDTVPACPSIKIYLSKPSVMGQEQA